MTYPFFFTWSRQGQAQAIEIVSGAGARFRTADGAEWIDLGSLSYQAQLGFGNAAVTRAIAQQAQILAIAPPNALFPAKEELARSLLSLAPPGFGRVFFTTGGAEANENALKIARLITGRYKTISRYRSYHGATLGALSVTGDQRRPPHEPALVGAIHALDCYCDRCPFGQVVSRCARECAAHVEDLITLEGADTVAAVILEPVVGANGVLIPPPEYWPRIRSACDRHGVLLIADEVLTGFGRTGTALAIEHFGVVPDIITLAKGLTSGYANLGAVLVSDAIAAHFDAELLSCGLTGYAHPIACAAGLATLREYEAHDLFARARALSPRLADGMARLSRTIGARARATRCIGLLAAIELDLPGDVWLRLRTGTWREHIHLHIYPERQLLILAPPLVITEEELDLGLDRLEAVLVTALAGESP